MEAKKMRDIKIVRKLVVIDGFVEIPNSRIESKNALSLEDALASTEFSQNSRRFIDGVSLREMTFMEFPEYQTGDGYPEDWFAQLNSLADSYL